MFDLTNEMLAFYYTEAFLYSRLEHKALLKSFPLCHGFTHTIRWKPKRNSYKHYYKMEGLTDKREFDLYITIIQSKYETFIITKTNHKKFEASFRFYIMNLWSLEYNKLKSARQPLTSLSCIRSIIDKYNDLFLPLQIAFINALKQKYNYSSYVIIVSIYSLYFKSKFNVDTYGQLIGIRQGAIEPGNYIVLDAFTITNSFINNCSLLTKQINTIKQYTRTQFTLPLSILNRCVRYEKNSIIFNSRTMFQHTSFPNLRSIYTKSYIETTSVCMRIIYNILVIGIQQDCYVLYKMLPNLPMWQIDANDFSKFCQQII